jgi:fibronectin-binding autotransporter adhesin
VGAGTLTLAGANVNTGPTEVRGGTLAIATSLGVTPVTVYSGGTLQLDGSVSSPIVTVQSGGRLVINNGGASLGSAIIQVDGRMDVTPVGGSYYLGAAVLTGSGVVTGAVTVAGGIVNPGTIGTAGRLTITNGDCTVSGGSLRFDLSNNPGSGNDLLDVNGNLDLSTPGVVVSINKLDGLLGGGTYVLAKCSGTLSGDVGNLTPIGAGPLDTLQISGNQLQLVVSAPLNLTWSGDGAGNLWDIGVSTTWLNGATPTTFANGNTTTFNNTGSANSTVNVAATVNPATVVVSGSANYSFVGAGDIGDGASLLKGGTGTLTILNTNTFTGQVFLNSGTLAVGNGSLNGHLSADITNAAALVFNTPLDQVLSNSVTGPGALTKQGVGTLTLTATNARTGPTTIAAGTLALGDGVALNGTLGSGPVTNSGLLAFAEPSALTFSNTITGAGGIVNLGAGTVTLSGVISGSARLTNDFSAGTLFLRGSNSYSGGTWINGGTVVINDTTLRGIGSGNIVIADGTANLQFSGSGSNVVANNISLPTGTTADQFSLPGAVTVRLTGLLTGGAAGQVTRFVNLTAGGDNRGVIILDNPANTFTTIPETYFGTLAFTSDGALGNVNNGVSVNVGNKVNLQFFSRADDGLRFDANNITLNPNRTITLVGNDNINVQGYNGTIAGPVTGLTLNKRGSGNLTVTGPGTLTGSTLVLSGSLLVNNTWTGTNVTVSSGATFGGTGTIDAPISVNSGGTLAPGTSIGTLTVHSNVTLAAGSTTTMEINAASVTSDRVVCLDTVNYSGTLNVLNTGGTLALGQSFQLFSAAGYTNNFTSTSLPALGAGLAWNWNPATGTISVTGGVATNPTNITMTVSGGNMNLSWPADHLGWRLQVQTNSLATGLNSNWSTWPNSTNVTAVSVPINPANPTVFFRLVYP